MSTDKIVYNYISDQTSDQSSAWRPQSRTEKKRCVATTDSNFHGQRKLSLEQQLCYLIKTRMRFLLSVTKCYAPINVMPEGGGGGYSENGGDFAQKIKFCFKVPHPWDML